MRIVFSDICIKGIASFILNRSQCQVGDLCPVRFIYTVNLADLDTSSTVFEGGEGAHLCSLFADQPGFILCIDKIGKEFLPNALCEIGRHVLIKDFFVIGGSKDYRFQSFTSLFLAVVTFFKFFPGVRKIVISEDVF